MRRFVGIEGAAGRNGAGGMVTTRHPRLEHEGSVPRARAYDNNALAGLVLRRRFRLRSVFCWLGEWPPKYAPSTQPHRRQSRLGFDAKLPVLCATTKADLYWQSGPGSTEGAWPLRAVDENGDRQEIVANRKFRLAKMVPLVTLNWWLQAFVRTACGSRRCNGDAAAAGADRGAVSGAQRTSLKV